jgi:hypothetical protein
VRSTTLRKLPNHDVPGRLAHALDADPTECILPFASLLPTAIRDMPQLVFRGEESALGRIVPFFVQVTNLVGRSRYEANRFRIFRDC